MQSVNSRTQFEEEKMAILRQIGARDAKSDHLIFESLLSIMFHYEGERHATVAVAETRDYRDIFRQAPVTS
jgi:hypothetical protein